MEDDFPRDPGSELGGDNRDLRRAVVHRHRTVQMRTRIMNQLQAVARDEVLRCEKRVWGGHAPTAAGVDTLPARLIGDKAYL